MGMKVLHVIPSYYPAIKYGGPIQSVHLLNKSLVRKGVSVDVISTNAGLESCNNLRCDKWTNLEGVKVKYFSYYGYEHYNFSPCLMAELLRCTGKYDLVHITAVWNFPVLAGSLASMIHGKPYIITPRGTIYEEKFNMKSRKKKLLYYSLIARRNLENASAIHFTTENEKDKVMNYLRLMNEGVVIPNGIDLTEYDLLVPKGTFKEQYPLLKNKKYILFLGRINFIKGLDILIEAFHELTKVYDNLFLVIAGPDNEEYGKKVKQWGIDRGILDKCIFTGMLSGTDKLAAYRDADIFVLPSYSENFGMTVVEAMACGVPVVITNKVGLYKEIEVYRAGEVVDTNSHSLYCGIKTLIENEDLRKKMVRNGVRLVRELYNIDNVADGMKALYERIIHENKSIH